MTHLYNFGLSQEDELTEAAALELGPADRVLSVASAGDMPLSLLALGAQRVEAVDIDPNQLHLTRLKAAAVQCLDREDAISFLGFAPASRRSREAWLDQVMPALPSQSRQFWTAHRNETLEGAIWAGRYERYVRGLVRVLLPIFGRKRFDELFACTSIGEQREVFARRFDLPSVRGLFRIAFHPRVFSKRGMDPRSLQHRDGAVGLGEQYFSQFKQLCTATEASRNHLLQITLLGRVLSNDAVPAYLSCERFESVRARLERLTIVEGDIVSHLEATQRGTFNKVHLSNVADWLPQEAFERVMRVLAEKIDRPGRLVWRYIHVDRQLPPDVESAVVIEPVRGALLREKDRFPFYGIVPARVTATSVT